MGQRPIANRRRGGSSSIPGGNRQDATGGPIGFGWRQPANGNRGILLVRDATQEPGGRGGGE